MGNLRKIGVFVFILLLCMGAGITRPAYAVDKQGQYVFGLWPLMGSMTKSYNDIMKQIISLMFGKMNMKVVYVEFPDKEKAYQAIKTGKIDSTVMLNLDYAQAVAGGKLKLTPLITYAEKGRRNEYKCIMVPKDSTAKTLADLKGEKIVAPWDLTEYISLRWRMAAAGINDPPAKFFGGFVWDPEDVAGVKTVSDGGAAAVMAHSGTLNFYRLGNASVVNKLRKIDCFEMPSPGTLFVWYGSMDKDMQKNFFDVLGAMNSFPEFRKFKPMLDTMKIQLLLVTEKDYEGLLKLLDEAKKKGWVAEYQKFKP